MPVLSNIKPCEIDVLEGEGLYAPSPLRMGKARFGGLFRSAPMRMALARRGTISLRYRLVPSLVEEPMDEKLREHLKQGFGLQQVLQAVEDQLIEVGLKDITIATRNGYFQWKQSTDAS
jgi:hypothetical protein